MQLHVIEKQIEEVVLAVDGELDLVADEREACAEFEQELPHVGDEITFGDTFVRLLAQGQEVERVRVLQACWASAASEGGSVRAKLVMGLPCRRALLRDSAPVGSKRLQPCERACSRTKGGARAFQSCCKSRML